jgi:hypothetical protein
MATAKPKKPKKKKEYALPIGRILDAVDTKNYEFYSNLNEAELKEFNPYNWMRYTSNISSNNRDMQEWFVEMTNEMVNKNQSDLNKNHKELLWKLFAAVGIGSTFFHSYLPGVGKEAATKIEKLLCELHPAMKMSDIKLMAKLMSEKEQKQLLDDMGFDAKQRKDYE